MQISEEKMIQLAYKNMKITNMEDRPVLITMHPQRSKQSTQKLTQEMFETFQIPSLNYTLKPQMTLYGGGRTSGLSIVIGHDVTSWMPIFDGFSLDSASGFNYLAGSMSTRRLRTLIQRSTESSMIPYDRQVESIKEKNCYLVQNYEAEFQLQRQAKSQLFSIPNYSGEVNLKTELFSAPEILFKPQIDGLDYCGLQYSIYDSIINSPIDVRKSLQSNIIVSGGTASLSGLKMRLGDELKDLDPELFTTCGIVIMPDAVWKGAMVLCNLESFLNDIVTKEAYDEYGPSVKFPLLLF